MPLSAIYVYFNGSFKKIIKDSIHQPCLCLCRGCLGHTTRNRPLRFTNRQDEHLNLREDRT